MTVDQLRAALANFPGHQEVTMYHDPGVHYPINSLRTSLAPEGHLRIELSVELEHHTEAANRAALTK